MATTMMYRPTLFFVLAIVCFTSSAAFQVSYQARRAAPGIPPNWLSNYVPITSTRRHPQKQEQTSVTTQLDALHTSASSDRGGINNDRQEDEEDDVAAISADVLNSDGQVIYSTSANEEGVFRRLKNALWGDKSKDNEGLSFRQKMGKLGVAGVLTYRLLSNITYCFTLSMAWYIFATKNRISPLAAGQKKGFLAVYGGFYIFNAMTRPLRLAVAFAISPYYEKLITKVQDTFRFQSKAKALAVTYAVTKVGTLALAASLVTVAATVAGVPIFAPKP